MNRRSFVKSAIRVITGGISALLLPRIVDAKGHKQPAHLLMGASNGQIKVSIDGGMTWRVSRDFGNGVVIRSLTQKDNQYILYADFQGLPLYLKSTDGSTWYTMDWSPPAGSVKKAYLSTLVGG